MVDLHIIADSVRSVAPSYGIASAAVFGSFARGDATVGSDVDILVNTDEGFSLFDAARFRRQLSEALGIDVDVVSGRAIAGRFAESVKDDRVVVYERP